MSTVLMLNKTNKYKTEPEFFLLLQKIVGYYSKTLEKGDHYALQTVSRMKRLFAGQSDLRLGTPVVDIANAQVKMTQMYCAVTFYVEEPMNAALGLMDDGQCQELDDYCNETLVEGYSFKAVDSEGNIVGAVISGESSLESKAEPLSDYAENCPNSKFARILHILVQREKGAKLQERFPNEEKLVEIYFAATDPQWTRRGILKALVAATEKKILEQGIKLARLDTSSAYTAKLAESIGYTCIYKAQYKDIKKDGVPLVVPAPPHVEDRVSIKMLT